MSEMEWWSRWALGAATGLGVFVALSLLWLHHDLGGYPWRGVPPVLRVTFLRSIGKRLGVYVLACFGVALFCWLSLYFLHASGEVTTLAGVSLFAIGLMLPSFGRNTEMGSSNIDD
jgi:hypothetical protein